MVETQHVLTVVWKETGLNVITSGMQNLEKTSQTTAKAQGTLDKALTNTAKSSTDTGKSLDKTAKSADSTGKSTKSLGTAFKDSSLLIAGFASSLVNTYMQYDRVADQSMRINRMRATLDAQTKTLDITEDNLNKRLAKGSITQADYATQIEKLASRREALSVREQQYTDMISDQQVEYMMLATSVIPTVVTGYTSIQNILKSVTGTHQVAKTTVDALSVGMNALGTGTQTTLDTFTRAQTSLDTFIPTLTTTTDTIGDETKGLVKGVTSMNVGFTGTEKSGNVLVRAFKTMGSSVKDFFSKIKLDMSTATSLTDKIKIGFTSFFSSLATGLKGGIKGIAAFGKALITHIVANPVLLIITAISAAVLALITNFGGFRDAVNSVGVAIGNAIPGLKGFLDWFGQGANAALDVAASFMGVETNAERLAKQAVATARVIEDPLIVALQRVVDIGQQAERLDIVIDQLAGMKTATLALADAGDVIHGKYVAGLQELGNSWEFVKKIFVDATPEVQAAIDNVTATINKMEKGHYDAKTSSQEIGKALQNLDLVLGGQVKQVEKNVIAEQKHKKAMDETGGAMTHSEKLIKDFNKGLVLGEKQYTEFAEALATGNYDIIDSMVLTDEEIKVLLDRYNKDFPEAAFVLDDSGKVVLKSLADLQKAAEEATTKIDDLVNNVLKGAPPTFAQITEGIKKMREETAYMADISKLAASGILNDDEKLKKAVEELAIKYNLSAADIEKVLQDLQKETENQEKAQADQNKETDKAIEKAENLAETRLKQIKADQLMTTEAQKLADTLGIQTQVTELTGKGLQDLIRIYDETANATGIAADSVQVWYAELEKNRVIETETIAKLEELATRIKIDIPDSIKAQGIPAIKEYIEQVLGIGDAAKKAKDEALKAFDDISRKGQEGLADLINEDLIKGDFDDVIEKIEETGRSLDQLSVQSVIIKPLLETEDFEDDLNSLTEIMGQEWAEMDLKAKDGGDQVMQTFFDGLTETYGEDIQPLISTMDTMWDNIKKENPGKTGAELLQIFMEAINKPSEMERLTSGLATSGAKGFESGGHLFATAGQKALYELTKMWDPAGAEAYAKGLETGKQGATGTAEGIKNNSGTPAEEMRNMGILMMSQLNTLIYMEITQTLPGYITQMGEKFTEMGNTAKNLATAADTHFKTVQTAITTLSVAFTGLYNTVVKIFEDMGKKAEEWVNAITGYFEDVQEAGSTLQSAMTGLYNTWNKIMDEMVSKVEDFASKCETAFDKVGTSADEATKKVEALQKAIDNLKDKEITVHVGLSGPGASFVSHGGSGINFPSESGVSYAGRGKAWIQNTPKKIGNTHVSEKFPEIITAIPLDPNEKNSPFHDLNMGMSIGGAGMGLSIGRGKGTAGGGSPVNVSGDLYVTVKTASGEVLATEVKPFLLRGFSGIT